MTNNYRICHVLTTSETNTRFTCHVLTPSELFVNVYKAQISFTTYRFRLQRTDFVYNVQISFTTHRFRTDFA